HDFYFMSFIMWLCAGITSLIFKYSNCLMTKVIVTKLKKRSQSAGNFAYFSNESTSETLCYKSVLPNIGKKVSVHVPIHSKPLTDNDFGHYLAGLIDGDGHFSKIPQLVIVFNQLDASLAYYIKGRIGFGNIYKVKSKEAVILVVSKGEGIRRVIELINGKIRSDNKFNQINNNILSNPRFKDLTTPSGIICKNEDGNLNNHWLAGFSDADASFQIKLINKNQHTEVRLNYQIAASPQKENTLLILIKNFLGGNIYYRKSQDTYYYGSTSFGSAVKVIKYFDQYHLLSSKHLNYLKWRKAYILIQNKEHLTESGLEQITKLKKTMNRGNLDTSD
ncbi:hypothetical protein, partial (mitochondrion) [Phanerochaete sordida]